LTTETRGPLAESAIAPTGDDRARSLRNLGPQGE
jgi:hypothetical protein